MMRECRLKGT